MRRIRRAAFDLSARADEPGYSGRTINPRGRGGARNENQADHAGRRGCRSSQYRPLVRETLASVTDQQTGAEIPVGDLLNDFDFSQTPLPAPFLPFYKP